MVHVVQILTQPPSRGASVPWSAEQLTDVFKRFDTNKDGQLSKAEVREAFKYLGSRCSSFRTLLACYNADLNNDGYINLQNGELSVLVKYAQDQAYKARTN